MVVLKPKVIRKTGKLNEIKQTILEVHKHYVTVISGNNKTYNVSLSDKVKLLNDIHKGDTAVIIPYPDKWIVTKIIKKDVEPELSPEEEEKETQRQLEEMEDLYNY